MALATHPLKGYLSTFQPVPSFWSIRSKLNHCGSEFHVIERKYRFISLKCRSCSSIGASLPLRPKSKSFKLSVFNDNQLVDSGGGRCKSSKSLKNAVVVSYLKHKSEESAVESSNVQNDDHGPHAASVEATTRSQTIQNLFKTWLMLLRAPSQTQATQTQATDKIIGEFSLEEKSETPHALVNKKVEVLKAVWCYIWSLDTTIRIPFLVFTPLFLAVNLVYGMDVAKELTPLWILGPLVVALYMKIFQALCGLYGFIFKQSVNVIKNLPVYYSWVHDNLIHGRLKETVRIHIAEIRNMNYNELTRRKIEDLQGWLIERYLDLVEFVWPYCHRTIRFLKGSNFI